uniref:Cytochrome P450 n=1 Tax=Phanerodontia chrysosporium TaxID=2822231 RepID=G5EJS2_PHACH|nr:cytochrome P450 [Phanerodontia chrysosporium]
MASNHLFSGVLPLDRAASTLGYLVCGALLALLLQSILTTISLRHIPTVGTSTLPLLSYKGAYDFTRDIKGVFQQGYAKYKGRAFKIAFTDRWFVVLTGRKLLEELHRLPDGTTSFNHASGSITGSTYIYGRGWLSDPWHIPIIRDRLTKHLAASFGDMYDELETVFRELMPSCEEEWVPVHFITIARTVVARTSNRVFVGLPACRNLGYHTLLVNFALDVSKARNRLAWLPPALKRVAARALTRIDSRIEEGMQYLGPTIRARIVEMERYKGDWPDKPNDILQWIMEELIARKMPMEEAVRIILRINSSAVQTTANSLTHAIYHLAANPDLIAPLREEVDAVITDEGWTKLAMSKLSRLDSFMRESMRLNIVNPFSVRRMALKSFTFSDGTFIPKGTLMVTPAHATHLDEANYEHASVFDPWRFVHQKEEDLSPTKHHFITTSPEFVAWGHGKHACPGRFFASNELKAMMAYIILNYDVKFARAGVRPDNVYSGLTVAPNQEANVLFRRRQTQ